MGGANSLDEVEIFLKNMFADKHILPMNRYLRKIIGGVIVKRRVEEVKENFKKFLGEKSPLTDITYSLIDKLKTKLDIPIAPAMRYVPPFASKVLKEFKESGVGKLILFPMYPQYSTTTTLSSIEDIENRCREIDFNPQIEVIEPYYDNCDYISICGDKIIKTIGNKSVKEYDLLLSAHGLPRIIIDRGDPYERQVEANLSALKIYLCQQGIKFNAIKLVYQSKVGNSLWLEPSLKETIKSAKNRKVIIYPLSFTIDNSETVFELNIETREMARELQYNDFIVVESLNSDTKFVDFIIKQVTQNF